MAQLDNEELVQANKLNAEDRVRRIKHGYQAMLKDPNIRLALWSILEKANIFRTTFTGDAPNSFFNEGMRVVGLDLFNSLLEVDPEALQKLSYHPKEMKHGR